MQTSYTTKNPAIWITKWLPHDRNAASLRWINWKMDCPCLSPPCIFPLQNSSSDAVYLPNIVACSLFFKYVSVFLSNLKFYQTFTLFYFKCYPFYNLGVNDAVTRKWKIPKLFYHTGSVYSIWKNNLKKYNSIFGPRIKPIETSGILNIDIDDSYDLEMARLLIRNKKLKY